MAFGNRSVKFLCSFFPISLEIFVSSFEISFECLLIFFRIVFELSLNLFQNLFQILIESLSNFFRLSFRFHSNLFRIVFKRLRTSFKIALKLPSNFLRTWSSFHRRIHSFTKKVIAVSRGYRKCFRNTCYFQARNRFRCVLTRLVLVN